MHSVFTVAEIGQAHDGSVGILHSMIDAASQTGVSAVKFQTHIAEAESSIYEPFRTNFSYVDKTRYDYWKRMELSTEQWVNIKKHCEDVGLEFLSSPFSIKAVELLEKLNVSKYKIGSGEVGNLLMLDIISKTGKPVILSSGMSSFDELDIAVNLLKKRSIPLTVLQCTTEYPTSPKSVGLNVISELKNRYNVDVGLSDHSGDIFALLAAVTLGAKFLEFHITFDKMMFGPDAKSSLEFKQVKELVRGVDYLQNALNNPVDKNNTQKYKDIKKMFGKSLCVNQSMKPGEKISIDKLEAKKPDAMGISANQYQNVIGKTLTKNKNAYDFLNDNDFE